MSIPGNANPLLLRTVTAAATGISRSLRFNSADSAYLSRTPASAGNRKTWTWAGWVKRSKLADYQRLFWANGECSIRFENDDTLRFSNYTGSFTAFFKTTAVYRDASAWYHIVLVADTANATASDRIRLYVNGERITSFSSQTNPSQNLDLEINTTAAHNIAGAGGGEYFSGYLADIYFIDGQALDPTSFGETDATTGVWNPKSYTGSYGTNGFHLEFADNSSNTATTLGKDTSPNGNNWTPNNLSVTAGAGNDSLIDSPTNYGTDTGVGNEVRGNYATLNALSIGDGTLSNGNLDLVTSTGGYSSKLSTIGMSSGKWYFEATQTAASANQAVVGLVRNDFISSNDIGGTAGTSWGYYGRDGRKYTGFVDLAYGATYGNNDCIGAAFDADNGTLTFYKNGISQGQAYSGLTSGPYFFAIGDSQSSATVSFSVNFGQRAFAYTAPSGFKALCTTNLPTPVVTKSNEVFDALIWSGDSVNNRKLTTSFGPDLFWAKQRNGIAFHSLNDSVRGPNAILQSNTTTAEQVNSNGYVITFASDGVNVSNGSDINASGSTYVGWAWDAGTSTVSNTAGSITSQVRANATAGFAVITGSTPASYVNFTFGHNLGIAPSLVIYKHTAVGGNWQVYHRSGGGNNYNLNSTAGPANSGTWSGLDPTSTLITIPSTIVSANSSAFVCYAFSPVVGYSSFGSYTGNGSADGPFVFTGMRPRWVMIKGSSFAGESWFIWDTSRNTYNQMGARLLANEALAENSDQVFGDILSNGFKLRNTWGGINGSSNTYIYAAFAEMPFNYSRAR